MAFPLPSSLSPSKITAFRDCPLAFRFSTIDKLPQPPSIAACKGTVVHSALERLFWDVRQGSRNRDIAQVLLNECAHAFFETEDWEYLANSGESQRSFLTETAKLVNNYFLLEDPNTINALGLELMVAIEAKGPLLRGIIDRLDIDQDGELIIVDYKTGRAPGANYEQMKMTGVQFYAHVCEQLLGKRPKAVHLLHLREPVRISATITDQHIRGSVNQSTAVWKAVERACETEDFRPKPSKLCNWCPFRAHCPAVGGTLPPDPTVHALR